jgi:hypothetical protein
MSVGDVIDAFARGGLDVVCGNHFRALGGVFPERDKDRWSADANSGVRKPSVKYSAEVV